MIEARKAKLLIKRHCEERVRAIERGGVLACATVTRAKDPLTPSELRGSINFSCCLILLFCNVESKSQSDDMKHVAGTLIIVFFEIQQTQTKSVLGKQINLAAQTEIEVQ